MATYTYSFNQANGAIGGNFSDYTTPGLVIVSNAAVAASANTFTVSKHTAVQSTDDFEIEITVGPTAESDITIFIFVRSDSGGSSYVLASFTDAAPWEINYDLGSGLVLGNTSAGSVDFTTTDLLKFSAVGRGFTMYKNGVGQVTWPDTGNASNKGASYRYGMIGVISGATNKGIDAAVFRDIVASGSSVLFFFGGGE